MTHALILLVDDDLEEQMIFKEVMNMQNNLSVLYFDSAQLVLSYLASLANDALLPKLVISDINMPKISGLELLKQIRLNSRYDALKVIMLSTAHKSDYEDACNRLGALEFIQKPDTYVEMKRLVHYVTALAMDKQKPPFKRMPSSLNA